MIKLKKGDDFIRTIAIKDPDLVAIVPEEVAAQIRSAKDTLIEELKVSNGEEAGEYILSSIDTYKYPLGVAKLEIRMTISGEKISAKTIQLLVEDGYETNGR